MIRRMAWRGPISLFCLSLLAGFPAALKSQDGMAINAGMVGTWANPAIPGQGISVDVDPGHQTVFLAWFTFSDDPVGAESIIGAASNRWYVAVGEYAPGSSSVELSLIETGGGIFDRPAAVTETTVGAISLAFLSCTEADLEFTFSGSGKQGQIALTRLTSAEICESLNAGGFQQASPQSR